MYLSHQERPEKGPKESPMFPICVHLFFFKTLFIYLTERAREHKQREPQAEGEGEAGSPLSREPDVGLRSQDPET